MTESETLIRGSSSSCNFKLPWTPKPGMVVRDGKQWVVFTKVNPPFIEYSEISWLKAQVMRFVFWARSVK